MSWMRTQQRALGILASWLWLIFVLLCCVGPTAATFLPQPHLWWNYTLPVDSNGFDRSVLQGNGAVVSQDGSRVFVTAQDGSLHILRTGDLNRSVYFEPTGTNNGTGFSCQSSISLHESPNGVHFAVYAVIENDTSLATANSRVIAVDPDGKHLWTVNITGTASGTPVVNGNGTRVYVTHNAISPYTSSLDGFITTIVVDSRAGYHGSIDTTLPHNSQGSLGTLTPVTVRTVRNGGDSIDVAAFAKTQAYSYSSTSGGDVYVLTSTSSNAAIKAGKTREGYYNMTLVSSFPLTASARPQLSSNGLQLYLAQDQSRVMGWDGNVNLSLVEYNGLSNIPPRWEQRLTDNAGNNYGPIVTTPILTPDDQTLFVTTSAPNIVAINVNQGSMNWANSLTGNVLADPVLAYPKDGSASPVVHVFEVRHRNALGDVLHFPLGVLIVRRCYLTTTGFYWHHSPIRWRNREPKLADRLLYSDWFALLPRVCGGKR